ncbi:MAG: hypothetical protein WED09_00630 [Homoserinimonas sp.]
MPRLFSRLLEPVYHLWSPVFLLRAGLASSRLPKPTDAPVVHIDGPDPDRLLVAGGGIVVGFGVLSHELGIAGHLARLVSGATGRGVKVDIIAESDFRIDDVGWRIRDITLSAYDAIVLFIGVTDAIRYTPARSWHRHLSAVVDNISARAAAGARIFVVGIQPIRLVTTLNNRAGFLAELHARGLDRESIRVCSQRPNASFVPFRPSLEATDRYRSSTIYRNWAALVSPPIVEALTMNHPLEDFTI